MTFCFTHNIPVLETERLVLRGLQASDFEPFAAFLATDAARFVGGPCNPVDAWRRMSAYAGSWALRSFGKFAVEEKATGKFAGVVGPWFPEGWPEPEIAWTLLSEFQGKGLAAEAATRALRFAYDTLGWTTAVSCMDPLNQPSIALAERLGATLEGPTEIKPYGEALLYRHRGPEAFGSGNSITGGAA